MALSCVVAGGGARPQTFNVYIGCVVEGEG
jgi:hypothetical protein